MQSTPKLSQEDKYGAVYRRSGLWAALWTITIALSGFWNISNLKNQAVFLATSEARAHWNKDQAFRKWATKHGGVYVKPDERTPPSPYLAHLQDRDVETSDGTKLTLMNPAYMMRQMTEEFEVLYGIKGKITGQILLNPINKADSWELEALKAFDKGLTERIETAGIGGKPYLRLMRPMIMAEGCVKCHGHLGFKVGDIRGGVSISVPLTPYLQSLQAHRGTMVVAHASIWLLGLVMIGWMFWRACRHVKEKQMVEETLRRAQKMDAIGQLTGGIAHDFNNILGIILGNLNLLKLEMVDNPKALGRVRAADRAALRAADLTKQLLGFSRKQTLQRIPVDINQAIREMESLIARSVTPEVEVEYNLKAGLWLTEIDPGDFADSLLNLVLNARDAMSGPGKLGIETANTVVGSNKQRRQDPTVDSGEYVEVTVSDNGCGISQKIMDRIFEPFFTTKPQGKGTGLGMSMVFGFVQRSNGHIRIDSEPNTGTIIHLFLPRSAQKEISPMVTEARKDPSTLHGNEKILIVDDEKELLDLSKRYLEELGYTAVCATSGQEALDILVSEPDIDLLFSDVVMPGGMNGYELSEKALQNRPELKVLLTSGYADNTAKPDAISFESLLRKPYSRTALAQRIRSLFDSQKIS